MHPRLPGTTKSSAHPDTALQCARPLCGANMIKKRVGGENGMAQCKVQLDYFSDSELDSESDEGENYRYIHKYETLI